MCCVCDGWPCKSCFSVLRLSYLSVSACGGMLCYVARALLALGGNSSSDRDEVHPLVLKSCYSELAYLLSVIFEKTFCPVPSLYFGINHLWSNYLGLSLALTL